MSTRPLLTGHERLASARALCLPGWQAQLKACAPRPSRACERLNGSLACALRQPRRCLGKQLQPPLRCRRSRRCRSDRQPQPGPRVPVPSRPPWRRPAPWVSSTTARPPRRRPTGAATCLRLLWWRWRFSRCVGPAGQQLLHACSCAVNPLGQPCGAAATAHAHSKHRAVV